MVGGEKMWGDDVISTKFLTYVQESLSGKYVIKTRFPVT